jgi:molybdopterin-containing oxidoreductase family iron-sulfur binding subunit
LSIQQPLIAPLYRSFSELEILARILDLPKVSPYDLVRDHWDKTVAQGPQSDIIWRYSLHDGHRTRQTRRIDPVFDWSRLPGAWTSRSPWPSSEQLELTYQLDWSVLDGRYAHIPWLQEAPDPVTKLTWDNALLLGPATAKALGVDSREMVRLTVGRHQMNVAVWVVPGVAAGSLILPLGYGRTAGPRTTLDLGFNANLVRTSVAPNWASGVRVQRIRGLYELASTQDYGSLKPSTEEAYGVPQSPSFGPRPIVRQATLAQYREDPKFVEKHEVIAPEKIKSLFVEPNRRDGQQWGMSIDLNSCTGCNACLVACQAENNIPVVGKQRVLNGREMHWIRLDRYFTGEDPDDPQVLVQPLGCQHCENAPCETVCPVAATAHSDDGLNDMIYNRCIGTRYCSNNCPFKVRRFNYFNFPKEDDQRNPLVALQRNPDVTVRFRGVMEKCTYCVQRIREAGIAYKREGHDKVPDGAIVPACAQTCPTRAIVFGDVNDPNSQVSRQKRLDRDYALLAELNVKPRTTYLAKLRNPNPDLV